MNRGKRISAKDVEQYVHKHFHKWFKDHVMLYFMKIPWFQKHLQALLVHINLIFCENILGFKKFQL